MSLKFTEESDIMTMKNDTKSKDEFTLSTRMSETFAL